jgi:rod shape determining protein RodA
VGDRRFGAKRWLSLFGMNLQPSEIAKMGLIFVLARRLSRPGVNLGHFRPLAMALLIAAVPFVLILEEPDLGTGLILAPTAFAMMFVAGVPARALVLLVMTGVAAAGIFLGVLFLPARLGLSEVEQQKIMKMIRINQYQKTRIEVFLNLDTDPFGAGWNKRQSGISVGSGGAWGKGFLNGTQNILGYLPRSVAPTDFIYAVIAEEKGFAGSIAVLVLFSVIAAVGIAAALMAHDKFGRLLCVGIVCMIFGHVFINMAMTVGLMPITGLPLPLLSYGGSFMVITMSALGIVQSVYVRSRQVPVVFEQVGLWKTG